MEGKIVGSVFLNVKSHKNSEPKVGFMAYTLLLLISLVVLSIITIGIVMIVN